MLIEILRRFCNNGPYSIHRGKFLESLRANGVYILTQVSFELEIGSEYIILIPVIGRSRIQREFILSWDEIEPDFSINRVMNSVEVSKLEYGFQYLIERQWENDSEKFNRINQEMELIFGLRLTI